MTAPGRADLIGTGALCRAIVHRDRVRIAVWVAGVVGLVASSVAGVKGLFPTQADLDETAAATIGNAAAIALNGPPLRLNTLGGQVAFQTGASALVVVALMSVMMIGRLTRGEEEAGRLELLRSLPVAAHAPTTAALLVVGAMSLAAGGLVTLTLLVEDLPATGSWVSGLSFPLVGLVFAGLGLILAQVTENTRVVYGAGGGLVGVAYAVRAAGDAGDGTLSWFSPIGFAQKARPFAGEQWWPYLPMLAAAGGLIALAVVLAARRDLGGGLFPARPGRPAASPALGRPSGLALRLQRGSLIGWAVGLAVMGLQFGAIANSIDEFVGENEAMADILTQAGGATLTESYLSTCLLISAMAGAAFALASVLRLRSEETGLRAEPVLATPVSRTRWAASHLAVAFGGTVGLLTAAGLGTGIAYGIVADDLGEAFRLLGASLAYAPAMWVLAGLATVLFGWAPRFTAAVWAAFTLLFVIGMFGELLNLPGWLSAFSPFEHVPKMPAADFSVLPLAVLTGLAAGLTGAGLAGVRRRDIG